LADEDVPPERYRSGLDPPGLCPVAVEDRLLADDGPRADSQEIGTDRHAPGEDHSARPDSGAKPPQVEPVERRADKETGGRARSDERLDDPKAHVRKAPHSDIPLFPASDEHPFGSDRYGGQSEKRRAARQSQSQVNLDGTRTRRDPGISRGDGKQGEIRV